MLGFTLCSAGQLSCRAECIKFSCRMLSCKELFLSDTILLRIIILLDTVLQGINIKFLLDTAENYFFLAKYLM